MDRVRDARGGRAADGGRGGEGEGADVGRGAPVALVGRGRALPGRDCEVGHGEICSACGAGMEWYALVVCISMAVGGVQGMPCGAPQGRVNGWQRGT